MPQAHRRRTRPQAPRGRPATPDSAHIAKPTDRLRAAGGDGTALARDAAFDFGDGGGDDVDGHSAPDAADMFDMFLKDDRGRGRHPRRGRPLVGAGTAVRDVFGGAPPDTREGDDGGGGPQSTTTGDRLPARRGRSKRKRVSFQLDVVDVRSPSTSTTLLDEGVDAVPASSPLRDASGCEAPFYSTWGFDEAPHPPDAIEERAIETTRQRAAAARPRALGGSSDAARDAAPRVPGAAEGGCGLSATSEHTNGASPGGRPTASPPGTPTRTPPAHIAGQRPRRRRGGRAAEGDALPMPPAVVKMVTTAEGTPPGVGTRLGTPSPRPTRPYARAIEAARSTPVLHGAHACGIRHRFRTTPKKRGRWEGGGVDMDGLEAPADGTKRARLAGGRTVDGDGVGGCGSLSATPLPAPGPSAPPPSTPRPGRGWVPNNEDDTPLLGGSPGSPLPCDGRHPRVGMFTAHYAAAYGVAGVVNGSSLSVLLNDGSAVVWENPIAGGDDSPPRTSSGSTAYYISAARRRLPIAAAADAAVPAPLAGKLKLATFLAYVLARRDGRTQQLDPSHTECALPAQSDADAACWYISGYDPARGVVEVSAVSALMPYDGGRYCPSDASSSAPDTPSEPPADGLLWEDPPSGEDAGSDSPSAVPTRMLTTEPTTLEQDIDALFSEGGAPAAPSRASQS